MKEEIWEKIEPRTKHNRFGKFIPLIAMAVCALIFIPLGFSVLSTPHHKSQPLVKTTTGAAPKTEVQKTMPDYQGSDTPKKNPLFDTTLTLSNGTVVTPNQTVNWKDLSIQLQISSLPGAGSTLDGTSEIIGNHSEMLSHETVKTAAGDAFFILNKRTQPAAAQSTDETYEYWVIVYKSQYAYAIEAIVTGDRDQAKAEVKELLGHWKVPD